MYVRLRTQHKSIILVLIWIVLNSIEVNGFYSQLNSIVYVCVSTSNIAVMFIHRKPGILHCKTSKDAGTNLDTSLKSFSINFNIVCCGHKPTLELTEVWVDSSAKTTTLWDRVREAFQNTLPCMYCKLHSFERRFKSMSRIIHYICTYQDGL